MISFAKILASNTVPKMRIICRLSHSLEVNRERWKEYLDISESCDEELQRTLVKDMTVIEEFLSDDEENSLFQELEPYMKKLHYEFDHWDDAIHGYRETERLQWNKSNTIILDRVRNIAFPPGTPQLKLVHVLDLTEEGYIKPHIDSVRFCGNTIAGLSLLTDCVMRLAHHKQKEITANVLLKRKSLYIMKGIARFDFTHEILPNDCSKFRDGIIHKGRRVSVICRNEPSGEQNYTKKSADLRVQIKNGEQTSRMAGVPIKTDRIFSG
ncbi:alpha-ketoglutarate-dependent dioxygenase alkB homolog 7, mitochondrial isoform X2 [Anabrus simplex]|uniref:alpha-ketoglutarate-dependent dioxygenase alkB homolog 7, mitochondrial isoform X2 n=1 Tax=Anabrus simplex TaxID=316456 RepID=UPI0034DD9659